LASDDCLEVTRNVRNRTLAGADCCAYGWMARGVSKSSSVLPKLAWRRPARVGRTTYTWKDARRAPWSVACRPTVNRSVDWIVIPYACARVCVVSHSGWSL